MTAAPSFSLGSLQDFAGVYVAKPQHLLIGPLIHLEHFLTAPTGAAFPSRTVVLPPPSLRYVVDCAPHPSDLPLMPEYATAPPLMSNEDRVSAVPTTTATGAPTESAEAMLPSASPATVTPVPAASPQAHDSALNPATTSLFSPPDTKMPVTVLASSVTTSATTTTTTAASATPAAAPASLLSTREVVERMHKNAEECLARLRLRCVHNGMSTAAFIPVPPADPSGEKSAPAPATSSSSFSTPPLPTASPQLAGATSNTPGPVTANAATTTTTTANTSSSHHNAVTASPKDKTELFESAKLNADLHSVAEKTLGADHVLRCLIPNTADSLASAPVQDTVRRLRHTLRSNPEALVYVYSLDGKGTASALAALYLLEVDRVALAEVLLQRLPMCTPRMPCLVQLVARDPQPQSFDKLAYLRLYLARRYPAAAASSIEAAVSTCKGDYVKAERLVRLEMTFQRVDGFLPSRSSWRSGGAAGSCYTQSASSTPSAANLNKHNRSSSGFAHRGGGGGGGAHGDTSLSEFFLCSSFVRDPVRLTERDEATIDSLYRALADGRVGVSRDDVRESYTQHHRSQDLVLREFLLRFRAADVTETPPRTTQPTSYGSDNGSATPATTGVEGGFALPRFGSPSTSRRGSTVPGRAATKAASAESQRSPEPTRPSVHSPSAPRETAAKSAVTTPKKERRRSTLPAAAVAEAGGTSSKRKKANSPTPPSATQAASASTAQRKRSATTPQAKDKAPLMSRAGTKSPTAAAARTPQSLTALPKKKAPLKGSSKSAKTPVRA
ncbi:hypothetical protein ABB37_06474 [Leptomonas pyrrhocoris]|uniref:Uncharacterized protein n=1 Tax=Leptomonas pyrrhocoris TaxID=157538 RepID=A0A0M9FXW8_LEPPY|nr:hypothetical protein ABB37_06474 [Leptomonas pyrrhocoris]KPA78345.1 hypothetical protein ABB37_06474 [Leptomonas pyrrhocoris]|eukprot:XP_015656784.1 hypothetical protein ABB37_06474 [Leptomonas pyrrhocoris]